MAQMGSYQDPQGRFRFEYPAVFGAPSRGTDDGFGDRIAAVRFEAVGADFAVVKRFPMIDLQAAGGLYDSIALQILPDALRAKIVGRLPRLSTGTLCAAIGREAAPELEGLTEREMRGVRAVQATRHVAPRVVRCETRGQMVLFDKETALAAGAPRQHVYGAVRFLDGVTVQMTAYGAEVPAGAIDQMAAAVGSYR